MKRIALIALLLSAATAVQAQVLAPDAATTPDAGTTHDAGSAPDAGSASNAASELDAGPASDFMAAAQATLSASELEELGFGSTAEETLDTSIKLYGFADFTFSAGLMSKENAWRMLYNRYPTFWVGNFNVYVSKNLSEHFRTMGEVRFSFLPNGNVVPPDSKLVTDTTSLDYSDFNRPLRWGSIEIERLYLEWSLHRFVTARVGQYLTPYGIWNVDHGTPTFITTGKPYVIGNQLFPEHQTGVELFGRWEPTSYSIVGYHLTLSNGTGAVSEYRDLDNNKAIGWRGYWQYRKRGDLRVGISGYYGRDTSSDLSLGLSADAKHVTYHEKLTTQSDSLALAADIVWRVQRWHVQGEWISQQRRFTDKGRVQGTNVLTGEVTYPIDTFAWGAYALVGYRFHWLATMPYFEVQYFDQLDPLSKTVTKLVGFNPGVNFRPTDAVVFKLAYFEAHFPGGHFASNKALRLGQVQIAWAF